MDGKQRLGCSAGMASRTGVVNRIWMHVMVVVLSILLVCRGSDGLSPDEGPDARRHAYMEGA